MYHNTTVQSGLEWCPVVTTQLNMITVFVVVYLCMFSLATLTLSNEEEHSIRYLMTSANLNLEHKQPDIKTYSKLFKKYFN